MYRKAAQDRSLWYKRGLCPAVGFNRLMMMMNHGFTIVGFLLHVEKYEYLKYFISKISTSLCKY